jgi:hypothetical protein
MSIIQEFQPVTRCGHIVRGDPERIAVSLAGNLVEHGNKGRVEKISKTRLEEAFKTFLTIATDTIVGGYLVLSTAKSGWTAVLVDTEEPWMRWSMCIRLSNAMKTSAIYYLFQPHTNRKEKGKEKGEFGAYQLVIAERGKLVRSVGVRYEAGWHFESEGKIQTFERRSAYRAPRARDRFGPSLLREYLAAMGLFPFEDEFFLKDGQVRGYRVYAPWYSKSKRISLRTLCSRSGPFAGFVDDAS